MSQTTASASTTDRVDRHALNPASAGNSFDPVRPVRVRRRHPEGSLKVVVVWLAVGLAASRGALELILPKSLAYAAQAFAIVLMMVSALKDRRWRPTRRLSGSLVALAVFMISAAASSFVSAEILHTGSPAPYVAVMLLFVSMFMVYGCGESNGRMWSTVPIAIVSIALLSVVLATLQQLNMDPLALPGRDVASLGGSVRPPGLTGSYLHYPLLISLAAFVAFQFAGVRNSRLYLFSGCALLLATITSYGRSGGMIVSLGLAHRVVTDKSKSTRLRFAGAAIFGAPVGAVLIGQTSYWARLISALDTQGTGNIGRAASWRHGWELFLDGGMVYGQHTGAVTNVTRNLTSSTSIVVESSLLQQLLSFGVFGTIAFYAIVSLSYRAVPHSMRWLKAAGFAAIGQTIVYQSIEVIPFMLILSLLPALAREASRQVPSTAIVGRLQSDRLLTARARMPLSANAGRSTSLTAPQV